MTRSRTKPASPACSAARAGSTARAARRAWIAAAEAASLSSYGLKHQVLDRQALTALEPALSERMVGGVHWLDPVNVSDPGAVTRGYAALLQRRGGCS